MIHPWHQISSFIISNNLSRLLHYLFPVQFAIESSKAEADRPSTSIKLILILGMTSTKMPLLSIVNAWAILYLAKMHQIHLHNLRYNICHPKWHPHLIVVLCIQTQRRSIANTDLHCVEGSQRATTVLI